MSDTINNIALPALLSGATQDVDLEANIDKTGTTNTADPDGLNTNSGGETKPPQDPQAVAMQQQRFASNANNLSQHAETGLDGPKQKSNDVLAPGHGEADPNTAPGGSAKAPGAPELTKKPEKDGTSGSNKTYGWRDVYNSYKELDENWARDINEDVSTLLLFAGLFATILTAFLVEVYAGIQPDNTHLSAPILVDISKQLHAMSLGQVAPSTTISLKPETPSPLRVTTTALWLLSLNLSLGSAFFGILVKQWVREYMRWISIDPLQHALQIRYYRKENRDKWNIEGTIVIVWTCLIIGLILFFFGLAILSFDVNLTVAIVAATTVAVVLLAFLATTFMSVFNPNCPYRTPVSSTIFILLSYGLSKFSPTATVINRWWQKFDWRKILRRTNDDENINQSEKSNHKGSDKEPGPWLKMISNTVKLWHEHKGLWMEDVWSEWDTVLHPAHDVKKSFHVRWQILLWWVNHQPVVDKDSTIIRCFFELPGSSAKSQKTKLQFEYLCQVLVDSAPGITDSFESSQPDSSTLVQDLPGFLSNHVWNIRFTHVNGANDNKLPTDVSFDLDWISASNLYFKIDDIAPLTGNFLLKCISWLTGTILTSEGQFASGQIDPDIFANLLCIYFMLVNNRLNSHPERGKSDSNLYDTYHRMMVNIIADQSTRRLGDTTDSSAPMNIQWRVELAGNLLAFSSSGSHFTGTQTDRFEVRTIILYITAAAQFLNRWKLKTPKRFGEDVATAEGDSYDQAGHMSSTVFWALATIVFDTGNVRWEELSKENEYRRQMKPFIRAVQKVLEFETQHGIKWENGYSRQRGEMTNFLVLNYKSVPPEFFKVMKTASEKEIFNLSVMIDWSGLWIISPFSGEWIDTEEEYLELLEKISNGDRPSGGASLK